MLSQSVSSNTPIESLELSCNKKYLLPVAATRMLQDFNGTIDQPKPVHSRKDKSIN
jgi:hypothetical protein